MSTFYENNPELRAYFEYLPIQIKNQILESGAEIHTLDELMEAANQAADHVQSHPQSEPGNRIF